MNMTFTPEVVLCSYTERPVFIVPNGYTGGEYGTVTYMNFYSSDGNQFQLDAKDIKKLVQAMKDWGFIE